MPTHLALDPKLLDEVMAWGNFPKPQAAVTAALENLANRLKRRNLATVHGNVAWQGDLHQWRTIHPLVKD